MSQPISATVNDRGQIKPLKPLAKAKPGQQLAAFILVLDETTHVGDDFEFSEAAFGREWNQPEEDKAWQNLDQALL